MAYTASGGAFALEWARGEGAAATLFGQSDKIILN